MPVKTEHPNLLRSVSGSVFWHTRFLALHELVLDGPRVIRAVRGAVPFSGLWHFLWMLAGYSPGLACRLVVLPVGAFCCTVFYSLMRGFVCWC